MNRCISRKKLFAILLSVLAEGVSVSLVPVVSGTNPQGPVTIKTAIDFSSIPFHGTFVVTEGSTILGCSKGNFVDTPLGNIEKAFTCTKGPGKGDTFTYLFETASDAFSGGHATGHWRVLEGTGFFARLSGQGDFSLLFIPPASGVETLTGTVHFDP